MHDRNDVLEIDAKDMCLVPDVTVPPKFKVLEFENYKGLGCLKRYIVMYCRKMVSHSRNDKLVIHCL